MTIPLHTVKVRTGAIDFTTILIAKPKNLCKIISNFSSVDLLNLARFYPIIQQRSVLIKRLAAYSVSQTQSPLRCRLRMIVIFKTSHILNYHLT